MLQVAGWAAALRRWGEVAVGAVRHVAGAALAAATVVPLRHLYFNGPTLGGYGFWGGAEPADACAQLTGVSASMWKGAQAAACEDLLERKFVGFGWAVGGAAYVWALYQVASCLWFRFAVVRPLARELRAALLAGADGRPAVARRLALPPLAPPSPASSDEGWKK